MLFNFSLSLLVFLSKPTVLVVMIRFIDFDHDVLFSVVSINPITEFFDVVFTAIFCVLKVVAMFFAILFN